MTVMISEKKRDAVENAIIVGMAPEDAYIYAGLTPSEITEIEDDHIAQTTMKQRNKELEYALLSDMRSIGMRQISMGRSDATVWMLEKLYPRYSAKAAPDLGTINFKLLDNCPAPEIVSG